jgi:hypothetical protein
LYDFHGGVTACLGSYSRTVYSGLERGATAASTLTVSAVGNYDSSKGLLGGGTGSVSARRTLSVGGMCFAGHVALRAYLLRMNEQVACRGLGVHAFDADLRGASFAVGDGGVALDIENRLDAAGVNIDSQGDVGIRSREADIAKARLTSERGRADVRVSGHVDGDGAQVSGVTGAAVAAASANMAHAHVTSSEGSAATSFTGALNAAGLQVIGNAGAQVSAQTAILPDAVIDGKRQQGRVDIEKHLEAPRMETTGSEAEVRAASGNLRDANIHASDRPATVAMRGGDLDATGANIAGRGATASATGGLTLGQNGRVDAGDGVAEVAGVRAIIACPVTGQQGVKVRGVDELKLQDGCVLDASSGGVELSARHVAADVGAVVNAPQGTSVQTDTMDSHATFNGPLSVTSTQTPESIGIVNAQGGAVGLSFPMPTANPGQPGLADQLTEGTSSILQMQGVSTVVLNTGAQPLSLEKKHDVPHALVLLSENDILILQRLAAQALGVCGKSVHYASLHAKQKMGLHARQDLIAHPQSSYEKTSEQIEPPFEPGTRESVAPHYQPAELTAEDELSLSAGRDINLGGTKVSSGKGGTKAFAGRNFLGKAIPVASQITVAGVSGGIKDTRVDNEGSQFTSQGRIQLSAAQLIDLDNPLFRAAGGTRLASHEVRLNDVARQQGFDTTRRTKDSLSDDQHYCGRGFVRSGGPRFEGGVSPEIDAAVVDIANATSDAKVIIRAPNGTVRLRVGTNEDSTFNAHREEGLFSITRPQDSIHDVSCPAPQAQYDVQGADFVDVDRVMQDVNGVVQEVPGHPQLEDVIDAHGTPIRMVNVVHQKHEEQHSASFELNRRAKLSIAFAAGLITSSVTAGAGGAIVSGLGVGSSSTVGLITGKAIDAGIQSCVDVVLKSLLHNNFDVEKTAEDLLRIKTFQQVVLSAGSGVLCEALDLALTKAGISNVAQANDLLETAKVAALREGSQEALKYGIDRLIASSESDEEPMVMGPHGEAVLLAPGAEKQKESPEIRALRRIGGRVFHVVMARKIGEQYAKGNLNPVEQVALHMAAGGASGCLEAGKKGIVPGACGAGFAESFTHIFAPTIPTKDDFLAYQQAVGHELSYDEFMQFGVNELMRRAHVIADRAKFIVASGAILTGQDVEIAGQSASIALDHNCLATLAQAAPNIIHNLAIACGFSIGSCQPGSSLTMESMEESLRAIGLSTASASSAGAPSQQSASGSSGQASVSEGGDESDRQEGCSFAKGKEKKKPKQKKEEKKKSGGKQEGKGNPGGDNGGDDGDFVPWPPSGDKDKKQNVQKPASQKDGRPAVLRVDNIGQLKETPFGKQIERFSRPTSKYYQKEKIFRVESDINDYLREGEYFYLDHAHKDHFEVFDSRGRGVRVLNLDGTLNVEKTKAVLDAARSIKFLL